MIGLVLVLSLAVTPKAESAVGVEEFRKVQLQKLVDNTLKDLPPSFKCQGLLNDKDPDLAVFVCTTQSGNTFVLLNVWSDGEWKAAKGTYTN